VRHYGRPAGLPPVSGHSHAVSGHSHAVASGGQMIAISGQVVEALAARS
jgi:hypothetical protein